jgi:hypothetical protein
MPFAIPLRDGVRLHRGPGANFAVPDLADSDECLAIVGRSQDGEWLRVRLTGDQMVWVRASDALVVGSIEDAPVLDE